MYSDYGITQTPSVSPSLDSTLTAFTAGAIVLVIIIGIIALAIAVFMLIAQCKLFTKAGEKWWKALIPFYSTWINTKITGLAWWWCIIFIAITCCSFIPVVGSVMYWIVLLVGFNYNYNLAKKFGRSNGFAFLCTILPIIGIPILAFGSSKYNKDANTDMNGIFAVEKHLVK